MNEELPSLDIAIATHKIAGIERVAKMLMPETDGIKYIVSWQNHSNAPIPQSILERNDVSVYRFEEIGLSPNKNNALDHCKSEIIYFTDDDVELYPEGIALLRKAFKNHPSVELATFRSQHGDMSRFPEVETTLSHKYPKGYSVCGIEIAFRQSTQPRLRYCREFGFGENIMMHGGEDEMLLHSAINRGMVCQFFPITICSHPHPSTGSKKHLSDKNLRALGCVIQLHYPGSSIIRVPLKAWRLFKNGQSGFFKALRYLSGGALSAHGVLKRNHDTLW